MNRKEKFRLGDSFTINEKKAIRIKAAEGRSFPRLAHEYDTKVSVIARIVQV